MKTRILLALTLTAAFLAGAILGPPPVPAFAAHDVGYQGYTVKTAAYTVTAAENGTTFTNRGDGDAITFTLPAPFANAHYRFVSVAAFAITVAADAVDTMICYNDLDIDSIAGPATTPGVWIEISSDGTSWFGNGPTVGASYTLND